MKNFIIIKNTLDNINDILDVFKTLVGNNIDLSENKDSIIVKYNFNNQIDVRDLLLSFSNENMVDITCYISSLQESLLDSEIEIGLEFVLNLSSGIYDLKAALLALKDIKNSKQILDLILSSSGVDESFVRQFVANDLNVSKASKSMYIHRNTLNYKLDKLYELSGFDLRVFLDSYIIYNLIVRR